MTVPNRMRMIVSSYSRIAVSALALMGCSGRGNCPPNGQMVTGATCHGDQLQCPYDVTITACDGTSQVIVTSCSCDSGHWACPDPGTAVCVDASAASDISGTNNSANNATNSATGGSGGLSHPHSGRGGDSSCPFIFAWNGSKFEYQTDIRGEVVGLPASDAVNRGIALFHSSHVKLPTAHFDSEHGIEIRLRETLPEASYFDHARLLVVDHPAEYEVWSSDAQTTYEWNYVEPFKIYTTRDPRVPLSAIDKNGKNVLAYLDKLDNSPAPIDQQGLDEFTLDFGEIQHPEHAKLLLDAWSRYRIPTKIEVQPYVEAMDSAGQWQRVRNFGPAAGDMKTVVVDLSKVLPVGARLLRVHLGAWASARQILDRIRLDDSAPVGVNAVYIDPTSARLGYRGTTNFTSSTLQSRIVASDEVVPTNPADYTYGAFTRYGDVQELLKSADDMYVIMRHGDQIVLTFAGLPAPPFGWVRSLMLEADVFYKVMYYPTAPVLVTPLPFHGMSSYPYAAPQGYPTDAVHEAYRETYNTRVYQAP